MTPTDIAIAVGAAVLLIILVGLPVLALSYLLAMGEREATL